MPWQPGYEIPQEPSWAYANWDKRLAPALMQAQQGLQGRGFDPSNPWWLTDTAFPQDSAAKLRGAYGQDLLESARLFLNGQRPAGPGPATQVPSVYQDDTGSGTDSGVGPANATGQITGFDPTTAMIALKVASAVPGTGMIGTIAGIPGVLSSLASMFGMGQNFGLQGNLTQNTPEGPISVSPTYSGLLSALSNAFNGRSNFVSVDPTTGQTMPALAETITMGTGLGPGHPAFGNQGFNAQGEGPTGGGGKGYGGYGGLSGDPNAPGAINFGFAGNRGSETTDAPASGDDGTGTGPGPGVSGEGGPGSAGDAGGAGTAGGVTQYRGGPVSKRKPPSNTHKGFARKKGSEVVPIKAHEGEFVVNKSATQAARPELEALNALVPPPPRNKADLASMIENAKKYFDVVA